MKQLRYILLLFLISGCSPDIFRLNDSIEISTIYCRIYGDFKKVTHLNDNSFTMRDDVILSLKVLDLTNQKMKFNFEFIKGSKVRFTFRTVGNEFNHLKGISFEIDNGNYEILEQGRKIKSGKFKIQNELSVLKIENDGDYLKIKSDCDDMINMKTKIPATEFMVIESFDGNEIKISGIFFEKMNFFEKFY